MSSGASRLGENIPIPIAEIPASTASLVKTITSSVSPEVATPRRLIAAKITMMPTPLSRATSTGAPSTLAR